MTKDDVMGAGISRTASRAAAIITPPIGRCCRAMSGGCWSPAVIIPRPRRRNAARARFPPAWRWARRPASPPRCRWRRMSRSTRSTSPSCRPACARKAAIQATGPRRTRRSPSPLSRIEDHGDFRHAAAVRRARHRLHPGDARTERHPGAGRLRRRCHQDRAARGGRPFALLDPDDPDGLDNPVFRSLNRNKRSIALDLRKEDGKAIIYDLVRGAESW